MSKIIQQYIASIQSEFDTHKTTEHSFRPALKTLLESLNTGIIALNESQRITGVGMPDFTIKDSTNPTINIGWIEAKDLYIDLDEKKNKDQLKRYLGAFDNFIYTNNLTFNFYRNGKRVETVSLGTATKKDITRQTSDLFADNLLKLERLLSNFLEYEGQTITSSETLARAMAQKAQLIKYAIQTVFQTHTEPAIESQYTWFKEKLIHDLTTEQFADMYAQTITYGLMAARLVDPTLENFSRSEAQKLLPNTSPFLKQLFKQIANDDELDEGIKYIIDDLVNIFLHCNVRDLLEDYGKSTSRNDPVVHFYETFLAEYDHKLRKQRGVWYTPEPVVKFIVRGVDYLLEHEFGLDKGLASSETIEHTFIRQGKKIKQTIPRVQVLDPATGTGTFLDETIKYVYSKYFKGQGGIWKSFVKNDFLPRLHGFEILMASYTMAHLKLGLTLAETYSHEEDHNQQILDGMDQVDSRLQVYLTNSLEQGVVDDQGLFSSFQRSFADEARAANRIKTEQPIMVVMGNPPYSGESSNKSDWIMELMEDYKKEPGGKIKLQERNSKRINDDYMKFIRFAESFIERNEEGIIAYICPHGFLDNPTFRGMRWKVLSTFDKIYTVDLHGNSKKKEVCPDGSKDENVFDIQQGVAITFFIKTNKKKKKELATVYHADIYGKRNKKYTFLRDSKLTDINFTKLENIAPDYFMVKKDYELQEEYQNNVIINELFISSSLGILTKKDGFILDEKKSSLYSRLYDLYTNKNNISEIAKKYSLKIKDNDKRDLSNAIKNLKENGIKNNLLKVINYRIFENKIVYFDQNFVARTNEKVMSHMIKDNLAIITGRQGAVVGNMQWNLSFITNTISDQNIYYRGGGTVLPLYIYSTDLEGNTTRKPNLDPVVIKQITKKLGVEWIEDQEIETSNTVIMTSGTSIGPVDLFDYIYAVLHSPTYRDTYAEFLKIDFPRIPFTDDREIFWKLVGLGRKLRGLHLMESISTQDFITTYPIEGDNEVGKIGKGSYILEEGKTGKVYINDTQYFDGVQQIAREFYIGGYQPAQKRLKDRKGRVLSYDDIMHYQKIIVALSETTRIMKEIKKVDFL